MEFLLRDDIDTKKWDARIAADEEENIFCYSWYLDAVSKNWGAFVAGDYDTIVPVPYSTALNVRSLYNPPFSREISIFGHAVQWEELLIRFTKLFRSVHFRSGTPNILPQFEERKHQYLKLDEELNYRTNAKRLIKKADKNFTFVESADPNELIELFKETVFKKIETISKKDLMRLEGLMTVALNNNHGELFEVHENGVMVGGGFFLKDKKRITYLKGVSTEEAKKNGAMYGLMNFAIQRYQEKFDTFDFGGSDVENVATFYKKFGAQDRIYYDYKIDNLPLWFKAIKQIKQ